METEQQQVEALQKWWKENGRTVVVGVALGLGSVIGWNGWQRYQHGRQVEASARYEQLMSEVNAGRSEQALARAKSLLDDFPDSGYGALAALFAARAALDAGNSEEARLHLRWAIDHGDDLALRELATLRLARVLLDGGDADAAIELVRGVGSAEFRALAAELDGDALLAKGDAGAARDAYRRALDDERAPPNLRGRVQMKLDDLGGKPRWPAATG